jgi:hypothetical protein
MAELSMLGYKCDATLFGYEYGNVHVYMYIFVILDITHFKAVITRI